MIKFILQPKSALADLFQLIDKIFFILFLCIYDNQSLSAHILYSICCLKKKWTMEISMTPAVALTRIPSVIMQCFPERTEALGRPDRKTPPRVASFDLAGQTQCLPVADGFEG